MRSKTPDSKTETKTLNTFIDLFSGCGGLSLGLLMAGWNGLFSVEKSKDALGKALKNGWLA